MWLRKHAVQGEGQVFSGHAQQRLLHCRPTQVQYYESRNYNLKIIYRMIQISLAIFHKIWRLAKRTPFHHNLTWLWSDVCGHFSMHWHPQNPLIPYVMFPRWTSQGLFLCECYTNKEFFANFNVFFSAPKKTLPWKKRCIHSHLLVCL